MSSYLIAVPETLAAAAGDLTGIREVIERAATAAAPFTTRTLAAAGDEVSAAIASFFGSYGQEFQVLAEQTTLLHGQFIRALGDAAAAYATAEAASAQSLLAPLQSLFARDAATVGAVLNFATNAVGLGNPFPTTVPMAGTGGVSGVRIGFSFLQIPVTGSFLGIPFGYEYPAPALWYFPTQSDGAVTAQGTTYLQHGFAAIGWFYQSLGIELASQTNSVVVTPTIPSIPLPLGLWLNSPEMQQGVGSLFLGNQPALNSAADHAGYLGTLPQDFVLTGHSAGGGLASGAAANYLRALGAGTSHLQGVVMFDGVAFDSASFASSVATLQTAGVPIYTVAAPPQPWNMSGMTTTQLASLKPGEFVGVEIVGGSHVDSMLGGHPVIDFAAQLLTGFSPPGATAAVYTLATGWINDMYAGYGPTNPMYGIYGTAGQQITLGQATGIVLPV